MKLYARVKKSPNAALCVFFVLVALPVISYSGPVFATDWSFNPSVTVSEYYDSNLEFRLSNNPAGKEADYITKVIPVLSVSGDTESTKFRFDTTNSAEAYAEHPSLDTVNTISKAWISRDWNAQFSTNGSVTFVHDSTLEDQLERSGIATTRAERYHYEVGLGSTYALSEKLNLQVSGSGSQNEYPGGEYPNSYTYQAGVTPVWLIDPLDSIGFSSNFSYTNFTDLSTIDTVDEMLYWQRLLGEKSTFKLGGGYEFTTVDTTVTSSKTIPPDIVVITKKSVDVSDSGPIFTAQLDRNWSERLTTTVTAGRSQFNDASGQTFENTFAVLRAKYLLSEKFTFNFEARYDYDSETSSGGETIDYYQITPSIERKLNENFSLRLSGSYERENATYSASPSANGDRYRAWVDLVYAWPRILASH
jgi:hypothetical protein